MRLVQIEPERLHVSSDLSRSGSARVFEERLQASIQEIGLVEPIKVVPLPDSHYLIIDGTMRFRAISSIRGADQSAFATVPAYVMDYERRYELRYQTDIYQDLLPSQLAALVEHLHQTEHIRKIDIARYIGVSPATLRNYTGLWRLIQRGGLFAKIVELMDVEVVPSSNPYAWIRLSDDGLADVLESKFTDGQQADEWIEQIMQNARLGQVVRYPIKFVEDVTTGLPPSYYREDEEVRLVKRDLGLRRAGPEKAKPVHDVTGAIRHLTNVGKRSPEPVLRSAARSLQEYLQ